MNYNGIIRPDQLAMMSKVLNEHCRDHSIKSGTNACENTASMIVALYRPQIAIWLAVTDN